MEREQLIIIGGGPAGLTASIYAARAQLNPLLLAGSVPGGLLAQTSEVENFPGFPDGVNGAELMSRMQQQAERFGVRVEYEEVSSTELSDGGAQILHLADGRDFAADALIVCTGASPRSLGLPSEARFRNHGVSSCATCDGAFYRNVPVAVVGGGDSAAEEALFLTRFASRVYLIHRRHELRASGIMADRVLAHPKISMVWNGTVDSLTGDTELDGVTVRDVVTGDLRRIDCRACFVALGHVPNTALFNGALELDGHGFIKVFDNSARTSLGGVFAAGDCADGVYRQAVAAAGTGCRAAMDAERYLERRRSGSAVTQRMQRPPR